MRAFAVFLVGGALALLASGCSGAVRSPTAHDYARSACTAYKETGRVEVATSADQTSAVVSVAQSDARAAAAFDPRWVRLSTSMASALDLRMSSQDLSAAALARFFKLDKRVQDECGAAGQDIGDLKP